MSLSRYLRIYRHRFRSLFHKEDMDAEISRELAFHFEQLVQENVAKGVPLQEARQAARRTLGNTAVLAEECRDQRRVGWLHDFWQDMQFGIRMLRKSPSFTVIAALSLALGIGANTAILGALNAVRHGSLPYADPDRLVAIRTYPFESPWQQRMATLPEFFAWRERQRSFESIGVSLAHQADFGDTVDAEHLYGRAFSEELFKTLGISPAMGRLFSETEYQPGNADAVMIITHRLWQNRFGGDPGIIGKQVRMQSVPKTVVGVLPAYFPYSEERVDYFVPMPLARAPQANTERFFQVTGRLKPGVTIEQAQADMDAIAAQLAAEFPDRNRGWAIRLLPIREFLFSWTREPLWTLEAAVILVLLITCANVAGLLLARGTTRAHEMAMRVSLGAGRGRLVRQLLTESLMLSLAGGALGILVAAAGLSWIGTLTPPPGLSRLAEVPLNLRLVAATALTSVATGLVFGLAPALAALRSDLAAVLQQTARPAGTQRGRQRLRSALVAGQVALAVVLLVGTGLLLKSFWRMTTRELNFETKGLLTFELRTPQPTYMREIGTYRDWRYYEVTNPPHQILESVRQRLAALPEAVSVAGISNPPVNSLVLSMVPFRLDGQLPAHNLREAPTAAYLLITPTFFATLKAELHGREFDARDTEDAPWVVVVNETAARRFWPDLKMNQEAIGKRIIVDTMPDERPREVVGVVRDIPTRSQQQAQDAVVYVPYTQHPRKIGPWGNLLGQMTYLVRVSSNRDPLSLVPAARRAAAEIAPDRPISNIGTVQGFVAGQLPQFSYYVLVLGAFALVATLLAAIGVYGVMSHAVAQRTREIGVRMALGACPSEVILWVARRGFMLIAIGLACGLAGAAALGQLLASQLWQVAPQDPLTLVSASLLVVTVAAGACYAPVRRAMSLDPTVALRSE